MRLLYNWLREFVDFPYTPEELQEVLDNLGIEVEDFKYLGEGLKGFIVAGEILEARPHSERTDLKVLRVSFGDETVQIVSGAPGMEPGKKAVFAKVGAQLPSGIRVEKKEIRGISSYGMPLCEKELGIGEKEDVVIFLPDEFKPGVDVLPYLGLDDWLYELYITPNRPDLLSILGLAYEIKAKAGGELRLPDVEIEETSVIDAPEFTIEEKELCPRFTLRRIVDVEVGESPEWLRWRLYLMGQRPVNVLVDISNYVLFETGHPTHLYDANKIDGKLSVRKSRKDERILTLDGVERELEEGVLIIADRSKPQALAGIMGGEESAVTENTRDVLLESAYFKPQVIRFWSQRLGLRTESSIRFEKGADIGYPPIASMRVAKLISELAGGKIGPMTDKLYANVKPTEIVLRKEVPSKLLGISLSEDVVRNCLVALGFDVEDKGQAFLVTVPTRRRDISIEADLVEEIARLYGYENIPGRIESSGGFLGKYEKDVRHILRDFAVRMGFQEVQALEFVSEKEVEAFHMKDKTLRILNPLTEQYAFVRPSLFMSFLPIISLNHRRGVRDVRIFQVGKAFISRGIEELPEEKNVLCLAVSGTTEKTWLSRERTLDFYDVKGAAFRILRELGCSPELEPRDFPYLEFGAVIRIENGECGWIGKLSEEIMDLYDLRYPVYAAEIEIDKLGVCVRKVEEIPKFPPIRRDLSVLMNEEVPYAELEKLIYANRPRYLRSVRVIDVYKGSPLPTGKKSITVTLIFQNPERTLQDEEVDREMGKLVEILAKRGYIIRGYEGGAGRS